MGGWCLAAALVVAAAFSVQVTGALEVQGNLGALHAPAGGGQPRTRLVPEEEADRPIDRERASARNEVSVAVDPRRPGVVVAAMHDFAENSGSGPAVVSYRSRDGGRTYERTGVFRPQVAGSWTADPSVAFDGRSRVYLAFLQGAIRDAEGNYRGGGLYVARSSNGGVTWERPTLAAPSVEQGLCVGPDKPYIAVGPGARGGRPASAIYLSWHEFKSSDPDACEDFAGGTVVKVARSFDGGRTFSRGVALSTVNEQAFGSMPSLRSDGTLTVSFILPGGSGCSTGGDMSVRIANAISRDSGRTFSRHIVADTCAANPVANGAVLAANSVPTADVSPQGELALVWTAGEGPSDNHIEVHVEDADGRARQLPPIGSGPLSATLQQWPAYGPNGTLHVMYLAASPGGTYDIYVTSYRDDAWSEPQRLTSRSSLGAGAYPGFGLGHYPGFDIGPDGVGHAMWTDARHHPAIYTHDVWTRSVSLR